MTGQTNEDFIDLTAEAHDTIFQFTPNVNSGSGNETIQELKFDNYLPIVHDLDLKINISEPYTVELYVEFHGSPLLFLSRLQNDDFLINASVEVHPTQ